MLTTDVINKLIKFLRYRNLTISTIEKVSDVDRRNILNDIAQINELLRNYNIRVYLTKEDVLKVSDVNLDQLIESIFKDGNFLFQPERPSMIILYLFLKQDFVSVNHFQDLLKMSKNTVLSDVSDANNITKKYNVEISYSRKKGYILEGNELDIQKLIDKTVSSLLMLSTGKWIINYITKSWGLDLRISEINELLERYESVSFVGERLEVVIYLISILEVGPIIKDEGLKLRSEEIEYIKLSKTYEIANSIVKSFPRLKSQKAYITIQLLSVVQGGFEADDMDYFKEILEEIIVNVQGYAGSIFPNTRKFRKNLYNHLVPSYFRMKFQIQIKNPLKDQITEDFPELFYLIKRSFKPLAERLEIEISDDEVAYFVMHFGSYFSSSIDGNKAELNAMILCPHGKGTSLLLKNLLANVMPEINFVKDSNQGLKREDLTDIDLIISTVYYDSEKPVYMVNPTMNHLELSILKRNIYDRFNIHTKSRKLVDELYEKIQQFTEKNNSIVIKSEMDRVLDNDLRKNYNEIKSYDLGPLLTEKMIVQKKQVSDWKEAIRVASTPLLELGYITENYIEAMINTVVKYGPYIVLVPNVAIPHAKPEDGSNKLGVSLLQLEDSVIFKDSTQKKELPVNLIFVISISDNYSHLGILKKINSIIENRKAVEELVQAQTSQEILKTISEYEYLIE